MEMKHWMKRFLFAPFTRLVVGFVVLLFVMALVPFVLRDAMGSSRLMRVAGTLIYIGTALGAYTLLYRYYEHRKIAELSFSGFRKHLLGGFGIGFLLISVVAAVMFLAGAYRIENVHFSSALGYSLIFTASAGVVEELLLRGVVFRLVEEKLGTMLALLISALLFGFMHIMNANSSIWASVAIAIEAGVLLAAAYAMTRNLWFPICIHWAWNFTEGYIYGFAVSGYAIKDSFFAGEVSGPEWLTGGAFGAEASVITVLVCSLASICFLWKGKQRKFWIAPYWRR